MLVGLRTVAPPTRLLSLFGGRDLELLTCGEADVDVDALEKHTSYGINVASTQPHIRILWQVSARAAAALAQPRSA